MAKRSAKSAPVCIRPAYAPGLGGGADEHSGFPVARRCERPCPRRAAGCLVTIPGFAPCAAAFSQVADQRLRAEPAKLSAVAQRITVGVYDHDWHGALTGAVERASQFLAGRYGRRCTGVEGGSGGQAPTGRRGGPRRHGWVRGGLTSRAGARLLLRARYPAGESRLRTGSRLLGGADKRAGAPVVAGAAALDRCQVVIG
jgi:hypothetical protein